MKISAALAYYNGRDYIDEQLDSILSQLKQEDEVIISVDSAEEGQMDLLRSRARKDPRIRLIKGPGRGVVRNFEHALRACSGDVIFLSDQDDIWEDDKVSVVMEAFKDKDVMAVLHNAVQVGASGEELEEPDLFTLRKSGTGIIKNMVMNSYVGCCMAFRRQLLPVILPIPDRMFMHDYWIGSCAEACGRVVVIRKALLRYRRHESNVTQMHHGSGGFMIRKRLDILYCLVILFRRRRKKWKRTQKNILIAD